MKTTTISILAILLTGCGGGAGSVAVNTWGEEFIEDRIPTVDGYEVRYAAFLIALSDIELSANGEVGASDPGQRIWDLTLPGPHPVVTFDPVDATLFDDVSAMIRPADGATAGNASDIDVARMNQSKSSVIVEGTATNEAGESYEFSWSFDTTTHYARCVDAEERPGVLVPNGGTADIQLTVHGDHFLYDDLQSEDPALRFVTFANADADGDHVVTQAELAAVDLTTLPLDQYGTGGAPNVTNLAQFVEALTGTLVHYQGEGHCEQLMR